MATALTNISIPRLNRTAYLNNIPPPPPLVRQTNADKLLCIEVLNKLDDFSEESYFNTITICKINICTTSIKEVSLTEIVEKKYDKNPNRVYLVNRIAYKQWCLHNFSDIKKSMIDTSQFNNNVLNMWINKYGKPIRDGICLPRAFLTFKLLKNKGFILDLDSQAASNYLSEFAFRTIYQTWMMRVSESNINIPNTTLLVFMILTGDTYHNITTQYRFINIHGIGWYDFSSLLENTIKNSKNPIMDIVFRTNEREAKAPQFVCIYDLINWIMETNNISLKGLMTQNIISEINNPESGSTYN